jgi:hypothetical protein
MNERIKELAEQANARKLDWAYYRGEKKPENAVTLHSVDLELFAELVIEDMRRKVIASILITDVLMEEKGQVPTSEDYILAINKDFGVE